MRKIKRVHSCALPKGLMIEPTNLCDLKCVLCPCGNGDLDRWRIPRGTMTLSQFRSIIDQAKDFIRYIVLWGSGEPMLVSDIDKMIEYSTKYNISVITSTHGNGLNSDLGKRIIKSGLHKIIFSIDGLTQETYEKFRKGGNYKKAFNNLRKLVELKNKLKTKTPFIYWQFIVMRHNEHEIPELIDLAKGIGVNGLLIKKFCSNSKEFAPKNSHYIRKEPETISARCKFLESGGRPMIFFNGDISVCSHDFEMKYVMSNVFEEKLTDIWNNESYNKFRRDFSKNLILKCTKCKAKSYVDHFIEYNFNQ